MRSAWTTAGLTTINALFRKTCGERPGQIFLDFSGETYSYAQTDREIGRLATGLRAIGVERGDRVCSLLDNGADAVFLWFAVNRIGAIYVPINTDYKGEFLRHQLADSGGKIIVVEAEYASRVATIERGVPALERMLYRGARPELSSRLAIDSIEAIRARHIEDVEVEVAPSDLSMLIYTSGTTGPSKGCMMSHSYALHMAWQNHWLQDSRPDDIIWTPCPLFHASGACGGVLDAMIAGATVSIYPRFSVSNFWPEIERSKATVVCLLSTMLTLIPAAPENEAAKRCYGQLRVLHGAPLPPALKQQWREKFGVQHVQQPAYGQTEAAMIAIVDAYSDVPDYSSGKRTDAFDVRIIDDAGDECPPGVPGEIIVRPNRPGIMFQGYWNRPEATAAVIRDLWLYTGDIGKFDENDFFYFVDRKKDYLRRGGENISSFEVEACFRHHPDVAEIAAHSVFSDLGEDDLKITIVLKHGATITEEALCRWSIDHVPLFALPRYIEFREALPTTPSGRVQKFILREEGATPTTWDRMKSGLVVSRRAAGAATTAA
jgi:crotonobetaine/carnitine-CoA ligase